MQKKAKEQRDQEDEVARLIEERQFIIKTQSAEAEKVMRAEQKKKQANDEFWETLELSEDPYDNLEGLAQYIHNNVGSTGVYIGQLEPPRLQINEDANEEDHLDLANPEVIKFKFANSDHKAVMQNKILGPKIGVSHEVFTDDKTEANQLLSLGHSDLLKDFKHIYVPEVIRNPNMHYWQVPRLGSFIAIPLVYKSCLNITSFN